MNQEDPRSIEIVLVTGRTLTQGSFAGHGKECVDYTREVNTILLNQEDMQSLGVASGWPVKVRSLWGEARYRCKKGDVPRGIGFLPYGPAANELVGSDTGATGMPLYKGFVVVVGAQFVEP